MMRYNFIKYLPAGLICALLVLFLYPGVSLSQFLDLEEESEHSAEDAKQEKGRTLPVNVVRSIKAQSVPDIKGAIKITWDIDPASDDDFIVGRAMEVPYSMERALAAKSVKMVPPAAERVVVDSNLPPGNYYYVILAKQKVMDRNVELFPNVNYTTVPVVIEKEFYQIPAANLPEQVTLIYAMPMNRTQVLLTWKGVGASGLVYNIYRSTQVLNTPEKIQNAENIARLSTDKNNFVDTTIKNTGNYYYAVTTKDIKGNEDMQLIPDQSYTAGGVFITMETRSLVSNLKAEIYAGKSVKLTWSEAGPEQRGKYLVYRDTKPITSSEKLALSEFLGNAAMGRPEFIDDNPGRGAFYYAVLGKLEDGTFDNTMLAGANCTADPVVIGDALRVTSITAAAEKGGVRVTWKHRGDMGNRDYSVLRLKEPILDLTEVKESEKGFPVDVFKGTFSDSPPAGKYYYALVPGNRALWNGYHLSDGINITEIPVQIGKSVPVQSKIIEEEVEIPVEKVPAATAAVSSIDEILRDTFFRGRYNSAIARLKAVVRDSGSETEIARARLFIGRSYIEKGMYRKSLEYLLLRDVQRHYPDESRFWSSFAITRVRGK